MKSIVFITTFLMICKYVLNLQNDLVSCEGKRNNQNCSKTTGEVCGWFNENIKCFAYPCAITKNDECDACSDNSISGYTLSNCENQLLYHTGVNNSTSVSSTKYMCKTSDRGNDKMCTEEWMPVCGYTSEFCYDDKCKKEYGNNCNACRNNNVLFAITGNCPKDEPIKRHFCSAAEKNSTICTMEYSPVCGYKTESCTGNNCRTIYGNGCSACSTPGVTFYDMGDECEDLTSSTPKQFLERTEDLVSNIAKKISGFFALLITLLNM